MLKSPSRARSQKLKKRAKPETKSQVGTQNQKPSGHSNEILTPKHMQNTDFSSKKQQIAGETASD